VPKDDGIEPFRRAFRALRQELQLMQEPMGELFGVSTKTVSRWELGYTAPDEFQRHGVVAKVAEHCPRFRNRIAVSLGLEAEAPQVDAPPNVSLLKAALDGALFEATELLGAPPAKVREAVALVLERVALTGLDLPTAAQLVRGKR
jgi:transcriptional regulator with XRE-family HTH domain